MIKFNSSPKPTIGVEIELQLVDKNNLDLNNISSKVLSDINNGDIESVYSKDILLSNIMIYLVTKTFNTASWIYYGRREEGGRALPKDHLPLKVPTAIAKFPKEYLEWAPKSYVERIYNVQQWTEMTAGGHFAALEQPELLIKDIIKFSKTIKKI